MEDLCDPGVLSNLWSGRKAINGPLEGAGGESVRKVPGGGAEGAGTLPADDSESPDRPRPGRGPAAAGRRLLWSGWLWIFMANFLEIQVDAAFFRVLEPS